MKPSPIQQVERLHLSHNEIQAAFVFGRYKSEYAVEYWASGEWTAIISDACVFPNETIAMIESQEILRLNPQPGYFVQPFPVRVRAAR